MGEEGNFNPKAVKLVVGGVVLFIILIIVVANFPFVVVNAGHRGVIFSNATGISNRILGEGFHMRQPFIEDVKQVSIQVQKDEVVAQAASKDLQTVTTKIVVNWHMDAKRVNKIYQNIGSEKEVVDNVLIPNTSEVVKAATAQYTAEELLTKRPDLKTKIDVGLSERLRGYDIVLDDVSIVDIDFSVGFNQAIERKAQAEQDALAEKNKLEAIKYQAEQTITAAKAEAESIKIRTEALNQNQNLIELEKAKRWNGVLPTHILGGAVPFFNIQ